MDLPKVYLGLIGAGNWGRAYIRTIETMEAVSIGHLCSTNPQSKNLVSADCRVSDDWMTLLAAGDLDGVVVATPPSSHAVIVTALVKAGLPVLVEKPLAPSLDETIELDRLVSSSSVPVLVDHNQLFHPAYRQLKQSAARLGPVVGIRSTGGQWRAPYHDVRPRWDYGPHDVALSLNFMGGTPAGVRFLEKSSLAVDGGRGEVWSFQMEFPGQVLATVTVGNAMTVKRRCFAVEFQCHTLVFDDLAENKLVCYTRDGVRNTGSQAVSPDKGQPIPVDPALPLTRVVEEFVTGIREPDKLPPTFGTGLALEIAMILSAVEREGVVDPAPAAEQESRSDRDSREI